MKDNEFNGILVNSTDKSEDIRTVSNLFRSDVFSYFGESSHSMDGIELGTSVGISTRVWSHIFRRVVAVDCNRNTIRENRRRNQDRRNITYVTTDLYKNPWIDWLPFSFLPSVAIVDARHGYRFVRSDIQNCLNIQSIKWIIFDDYGAWPGVKRAVDECVEEGLLSVEKGIGHPPGQVFGEKKPLFGWEGVICSVAKSEPRIQSPSAG